MEPLAKAENAVCRNTVMYVPADILKN